MRLSEGCLLQGYDVVVCRGCGFGFADGLPDQSAFDAYYRDMSKYEHQDRGGQQTEFDVVRLAALAEVVRQHVPPAVAVLDVGCSTGTLLSLLKERGFVSLTGLDPSARCAEESRRLYDIDVWTGTLSTLPDDQPKFDCLVLSAVLEHIRDLGLFLGQVKRWLHPDGLAVVAVPDATRFCEAKNAPFQEFSVEHINYFGPISLNNLMGQHGFANIYTEQVIRNVAPHVSGAELVTVYRHGSATHKSTYDDLTEPALRDYVARCHNAESREAGVILELLKTQKPIVVWGVGTHAQRLLATTPLGQANIVAFVDSNPKYQGKELMGRPVLAPQQLQGRMEPILISSWTFFDEIQTQIRDILGLKNEILRIHDRC
ncbi:MAG: methyltransferase domain-containing protein [Planctomycetota bacterium]|nr:methyltransferase domain-containing protein [Planctomycetota bacterium]